MPEEFPHPKKEILQVLKGTTSEPIETVSQKPGQEGNAITLKLAKEGSAMVGLKNMEDNKEWAGMFNHVLRTSRLSSFLAQGLREKGIDVDPKIVLNTVLVSHSGRRQWDESRWYPNAVEDAENKKMKTDTEISIELLEKAGISSTIIENVRSHDHRQYPPEKLKDNWITKIVIYADYRTSQNVMSLTERFDDLEKRAVPTGRITKEELGNLRIFFKKVEEEIFAILGDIKPEDITDAYPKAPLWENYIRRLYIQDAEESIFEKYSELQSQLKNGSAEEKSTAKAEIDSLFPETSWWGNYVRELHEKQGGEVYKSKHEDLEIGIDRAINNFE